MRALLPAPFGPELSFWNLGLGTGVSSFWVPTGLSMKVLLYGSLVCQNSKEGWVFLLEAC